MVSLLKSKRAAISGIISSITQSIGHFISTLPPIGKIMLFLTFLSLFGVIFSVMFSFLGYHCDSEAQLYKVSFWRVGTNIQLFYDRPTSDQVSQTNLNVEDSFFSISNDCLFRNSSTIKPFYNGNRCTNCTSITIYPGFPWITGETVCQGDAWKVPETEKTWSQKVFCDGGVFDTHACEPPKGYYFSFNKTKYVCINQAICGNVTVGQNWNARLSELGTKIPQTEITKSYKKSFSISCTDKLQPEITFYKIPIFNFKIWMFATVLIALITALISIKGMDR